MIGVGAAGFVPFAFIDADHFAGVAGDAAVGEEVGRVGEDEVDGGFGDLGEEIEAVAVVDAEVVFRVVEGRSGQSGGRFGHDDDRSGSLITTVTVSSERGSKERKRFNTESTEEREHRVHREERGPANREISVPGRLEGVAGLGGFEVLDAVAEEALLGEFFGEDDLGGDEDGGLAGLIGDGDIDEGLRIIFRAAFEAQAAFGHVLALDDVVAALGMADTGRVGDFDARMLAAIGARRGGLVGSGRRHGEDGRARLTSRLGASGVSIGWGGR